MTEKKISFPKWLVYTGKVFIILGGFYTLLNYGLFDSFFITPKHFSVYVDLFNKRQDDQERRLIRLETIIEMRREKGAKESNP